MGLNAIGLGLATLAGRRGVPKRFVVGHDYRSYSASVKQALMMGLLAGGAEVHDIGLALSPMAYFAQFALDVEGVAMVTASHNDNGWTGIKMGFQRPLTFGPEEMSGAEGHRARRRGARPRPAARYVFVPDLAERYIKALANRPKLKRKLKVVAACGNGTAGAVRAEGAGSDRLRGRAARLRARLHLPALQPQSRRHEDAARHQRCGEGARGRRWPRLRRRRRPLRRGRQRGPRDLRRQGRRDAGARSLRAACQRRVRRRREIDRPVHDRSGAHRQQGARRSTGRPATPT